MTRKCLTDSSFTPDGLDKPMPVAVRTRGLLLAVVGLAAVGLLLPVALSARASQVQDSIGDVAAGVPAYLDILHAGIADQRGLGTLHVVMELAAPVPDQPSENFLAYNWLIYDSFDAASFTNYVIRIRWRKAVNAWDASFTDRTALPSGGSEVVYPIAASIDGATLHATVPLTLLRNPSSFPWQAVARLVPFAVNPNGADTAPDAGFAAWTR